MAAGNEILLTCGHFDKFTRNFYLTVKRSDAFCNPPPPKKNPENIKCFRSVASRGIFTTGTPFSFSANIVKEYF